MKISKLFFLGVIIWSVFCLSSCHKKEKLPQTTLLLDWFPNPGHIPVLIGQKNGFFASEGIDLSILNLSDPPSAIPFLITKKVDIVLYYMPSLFAAASKTEHLKILGVLVDQPLDAFVYKKEKHLSSAKDFDQKILGAHPDTILFTYAKEAMRHQGIVFKEIKILEMNPVQALYSDLVDVVSSAFWTIEPAQLEALGVEAGYVKVSELGVPCYAELLFVTRDDFLAKDPVLKDKFQKALQKSIDYCKAHPHEAFEQYLALYPAKDPKTIEWEKRAWQRALTTFATSQELSTKMLCDYNDWMVSHGLIPNQVDVEALIR